MSKLYNKYQALKNLDNTTCYMFKSGIFYIFLAEDAIKVSSILGIKLTNLTPEIQKCGFPTAKLSKYIDLLKHYQISYQIVDENLNTVSIQEKYIYNNNMIQVIQSIQKLDLDKINPMKAFQLLYSYKEMLNERNESEHER